MLFYRLYAAAFVLQCLLFSTPTLAQEAPKSTVPYLSFEEFESMRQGERKPLPWLAPQPHIEGLPPLPQMRPRQEPHNHSTPQASEEHRFGYWGYKHKLLHDHQVITELLARTAGKNCCDGVQSGECRISKINLRERTAFIDGEWCPMAQDTRVTPLDTLANITDGNEEIAVVCASKNYGGKKCSGITTYCVGIKPPKV